MYWTVIPWLERITGRKFEHYYNTKTYRQAKGGRWNEWEFMGQPLRLWMPTTCPHDRQQHRADQYRRLHHTTNGILANT